MAIYLLIIYVILLTCVNDYVLIFMKRNWVVITLKDKIKIELSIS